MGEQTHCQSVTKLKGNKVVSFIEPNSASLERELKLEVGIDTHLHQTWGCFA